MRLAKGLGPEALAMAAGVSRTALYLCETGKVGRPRAKTTRLLAAALGVPLAELLGLGVPARFATLAEATAALEALPPTPEALPTRAEVRRYHALFSRTLFYPVDLVAAREDFPPGEPIDPARVRFCEKYQGWFHEREAAPCA